MVSRYSMYSAMFLTSGKIESGKASIVANIVLRIVLISSLYVSSNRDIACSNKKLQLDMVFIDLSERINSCSSDWAPTLAA